MLTLAAGVVTATNTGGCTISLKNTSPSALVTGSGRLGANMGLTWNVSAGTSTYTFPIGLAAASAPVTIALHSVPTAGFVFVTAFTPADAGITSSDAGLDPARDVNIVWRIDLNVDLPATADVTFNFAGFTDAGASPTTFVCRRSLGGSSAWAPTAATTGPTSITAANLSTGPPAINWFVAGNQRIDHYAITAASPQTAGVPFTATVTAQDKFNVNVSDATSMVTMSSNQGNAEFDSDGNGTFGDVTKPLTAGTFTISTRDTTPEQLQIRATDTSAVTGASSGITINPAAGAPASLVATAVSASQINLSWPAASGATSYEIWRSSLNSSYALVNMTSSTAYSDSGLTANRTYLYKVRAVGGTTFSPTDVATTVVFTDPALTGVAVKAVHLTELRSAADAMRAGGGLTAGTYTSIAAGSTITRTHILQLRTALDAARAALGLPALTYTDPTITPESTTIKAAHVEELRAGTQ
ncbi:MAG TPA: fibronectin type III domain-containing protein [Thermoanaerobaculia bacterium]|nr:fibronectin type III domain-containing protein [Thermoanaerobaculia bacterium]